MIRGPVFQLGGPCVGHALFLEDHGEREVRTGWWQVGMGCLGMVKYMCMPISSSTNRYVVTPVATQASRLALPYLFLPFALPPPPPVRVKEATPPRPDTAET